MFLKKKLFISNIHPFWRELHLVVFYLFGFHFGRFSHWEESCVSKTILSNTCFDTIESTLDIILRANSTIDTFCTTSSRENARDRQKTPLLKTTSLASCRQNACCPQFLLAFGYFGNKQLWGLKGIPHKRSTLKGIQKLKSLGTLGF